MNNNFNLLEQMALDFGFDSEEDMNRMISSIDLGKGPSRTAFQVWKVEDGTKGGLLKLIDSKILPLTEEE